MKVINIFDDINSFYVSFPLCYYHYRFVTIENNDKGALQMKEDKLKKEVTGMNAFVMVIGTIIGSGIFFKPTAVFGAAGTASLGLIAWVIGGLLALAGGLTIAEIGTLIPETGGMMTYMEHIYGKFWGYLIAWVQTIIFYPVRIAAAGTAIIAQKITK